MKKIEACDKSVVATYRQVHLQELAIDQLRPGLYQPRLSLQNEGLAELAQTIQQVGILSPLLVRPLGPDAYEIVAGERRWRAAKQVGLSTVPCLIGAYSDEESAQIGLIENLSRQGLDPITQAKGIKRLIEVFNYTHEAVALVLGKARSSVTNLLRLLTLDARIQQWIEQGALSEAQGKALAGLKLTDQYRWAYWCINREWSYRQLEKAIQTAKQSKAEDPLKPIESGEQQWIEKTLTESLGCQVKFRPNPGQAKGYLRLDYENEEQLRTLLEKLGYKSEK